MAVTALEKGILDKLIKSLSSIESHFCCGGVIKLPVDQKLSLLYKIGDQDQGGCLEIPPTDPYAVQRLLDACNPAPHGRGKDTVYDESYRLARELPQDAFALTTDVLNGSDVLKSISALTSPRDARSGIVARLYKLNAYRTGGFFKAHRDTPKSNRLIGTLVVGLPIPHEGGALSVTHEGKTVLFDWGTSYNEQQEQVVLPWGFLFSDVEHEVLPVTSGTRVTLAYDILTFDEVFSPAPLAIQGTSLPFYTELKHALSDREFLPTGGRVAVALSHTYPIEINKDTGGFASHLKGADAALHSASVALGLPIELRSVFSVSSDSTLREELGAVWGYEFGPTIPGEFGREVLYTSTTFKFVEGYDTSYGDEGAIIDDYGGQVEADLIWARKPTKQVFSRSGYSVQYGNSAELDYIYAATALILDVPAVGHLARAYVGT